MSDLQAAVSILALAWLARSLYRDTKRALLSFPTRLRWRSPVECGEGLPSETGLVECVKTKRPANRSDARVAREQAELKAQQRAMANRNGSGDDLSGWDDVIREEVERLKSTTRPAFTVSRPTPAENARRYAAEGGTW